MAYVMRFNNLETISRLAAMDAVGKRTDDIVKEIGCTRVHLYNLRKHPDYQRLYDKHKTRAIEELTDTKIEV